MRSTICVGKLTRRPQAGHDGRRDSRRGRTSSRELAVGRRSVFKPDDIFACVRLVLVNVHRRLLILGWRAEDSGFDSVPLRIIHAQATSLNVFKSNEAGRRFHVRVSASEFGYKADVGAQAHAELS
jgi:hypothetical protein